MVNMDKGVLIVVLIILGSCLLKKGNWIEEYKTELNQTEYSLYTEETEYYDYNNPRLNVVVNNLLERSNTPTEYAMNVGEYVYHNVDYDYSLLNNPDELYQTCLVQSASSILEQGNNICSGMSKLQIALLRGGGMMARPVTGCANEEMTCYPFIFTIYPPRKRIVTPILTTEEGIHIFNGGLHTWVETYIPNKGWVILEPTTGQLFQQDCQDYYSADLMNICGTYDSEFAEFCEAY